MPGRKRYSSEDLAAIFERGGGKCHLCGVRVAFKNYGVPGKRGAWHVDHSKPVANGGSDHGNNLRPAHIDCNLEKGTVSSRTVRKWNGRKRAPLSKSQYESKKAENAVVGAGGGAVLGGLLAGPPGAVFGALVGLFAGNSVDPDDG